MATYVREGGPRTNTAVWVVVGVVAVLLLLGLMFMANNGRNDTVATREDMGTATAPASAPPNIVVTPPVAPDASAAADAAARAARDAQGAAESAARSAADVAAAAADRVREPDRVVIDGNVGDARVTATVPR